MRRPEWMAVMAWLTWLLLESRPALLTLLTPALFALLIHWRRSGRGRPLWIGLALAGGLIAAQELVVTRREHAGRVLHGIEQDLVASRTTALEAALADDFDAGEDLDRAAFLAYVRAHLEVIHIRWLDRLRLRVVAGAGREFAVLVSYHADVTGFLSTGAIISEWRLHFAWREQRWQITHIRPVHFAGETRVSWRSLDRARARQDR